MDSSIEKQSDIIPVVLKDGQVQEGRSSVANQERFERLRQYVRKKVKEAGQDILRGEAGVNPYKSGRLATIALTMRCAGLTRRYPVLSTGN